MMPWISSIVTGSIPVNGSSRRMNLGRLVEKNELGVGREGASDFDPAPLSARQDAGVAIEDPLDVELVGELFDLRRDLASIRPLHLHHKADVVGDAHAPKDARLLGQIADSSPGASIHRPAGHLEVVK